MECDAEGACAPAPAGAQALPCLGSNNSIGNSPDDAPDAGTPRQSVPISKGAYKTEFCLKSNIELAAKFYGIEHLVFFTITFAYAVYSAKRAQKHLNSILSNVIRPRYGDRYLAVFERHASGAIHFHFVLWLEKDVRTGFDWTLADLAYAAQRQRDYNRAGKLWGETAGKAVNGDFLRGEWRFWRDLKKRYRWLGRCEMLPVKSTAEAIAKYTGGYIGKHMEHRREEDKGVNLVRYGKGMHRAKSRLAFNSPKARLCRLKLQEFAHQVGCGSTDALKKRFGPRWAYRCAPAIQAMPLLVRFGDGEVLDAAYYVPEAAVQIYNSQPKASGKGYRQDRLRLPPKYQSSHEQKVRIVSMVRSVFGESSNTV